MGQRVLLSRWFWGSALGEARGEGGWGYGLSAAVWSPGRRTQAVWVVRSFL